MAIYFFLHAVSSIIKCHGESELAFSGIMHMV
jgi:hypothetical protein